MTGGGGFLGSHFARRAAAAGHDVVLFDPAAAAPGGEPRIVAVAGDVSDAAAVAAAIRDARTDVVVHLATLLTDASAGDPVAATRVNALGTAVVFAAAPAEGVRRVVFASSMAALGPGDPAEGDRQPLRPGSVYGATKAFAEHLAGALCADHPGLDLLGLRFGWVYGPGRERGWRVVQQMIEDFALERPEIRYPDFPGPIDWTYADDAAEVLLRALTAPRPRALAYNVVGDKRPVSDAVAHLRRRFPHVRAVPYPAPLPPAAWGFRNDGLEAAIGYLPRTRLEDGLDRLVDWIRRAHAPLGSDRH
ncbi:MAG: NAD-dependent epimerase/dehydratase family protein [Pseudomonadota bacterium]